MCHVIKIQKEYFYGSIGSPSHPESFLCSPTFHLRGSHFSVCPSWDELIGIHRRPMSSQTILLWRCWGGGCCVEILSSQYRTNFSFLLCFSCAQRSLNSYLLWCRGRLGPREDQGLCERSNLAETQKFYPSRLHVRDKCTKPRKTSTVWTTHKG